MTNVLKKLTAFIMVGLFVVFQIEAAVRDAVVSNVTGEPIYVTPVYKNIVGGGLSKTVDLSANSGYTTTSKVEPYRATSIRVPDMKLGKQRYVLVSQKDGLMYKDASTVEKSRGDEQAILVGIGLTTGTGLEKDAAIGIYEQGGRLYAKK